MKKKHNSNDTLANILIEKIPSLHINYLKWNFIKYIYIVKKVSDGLSDYEKKKEKKK